MLNMMEAFSKAKEYWEVGLCVKASNLGWALAACQWGTERVPVGQRTM